MQAQAISQGRVAAGLGPKALVPAAPTEPTVRRQWRNTLRRRSQKEARKTRWRHLFAQSWFELPKPVKLHGNV